jgi:hypothetical protein
VNRAGNPQSRTNTHPNPDEPLLDRRTNDGSELEVDGREALNAFNHPLADRGT